MPNLDVKALRYMSTEEFRVLTAVEMGMKNHQIVPTQLIQQIAQIKRGGTFKLIKLLAKNKLVQHLSKPYDGYRLTFKGYDYLALKTLSKRMAIAAVGIQIGVGKESDIFTAVTPDGTEVCIKLHRLGRSFRTLKANRDYTRPGQSFNWLYMSRLSALKEYAFMSALHAKGFPVPTPIDVNRHVVVMTLASGFQLNSIQKLRHPALVFDRLMELVCRLASYGLIHCDFNEFNLLVNDEEEPTLIDFPQMISTDHSNATMYFDRDVECVRAFFHRRFGFEASGVPSLDSDARRDYDVARLDDELQASGWTAKESADFGVMAEAMAQAAETRDDVVACSDGEGSHEESQTDEDAENDKRGESDGQIQGESGVSKGEDSSLVHTTFTSLACETGEAEADMDALDQEDVAGVTTVPSGVFLLENVASLGGNATYQEGKHSDERKGTNKSSTDSDNSGSGNSDSADLDSELNANNRDFRAGRYQPAKAAAEAASEEVARNRSSQAGRNMQASHIAERVKAERRHKNHQSRRGECKGTRNETKNRERRKLASSTRSQAADMWG